MKHLLFKFVFLFLSLPGLNLVASDKIQEEPENFYTVVIEGYDWGPAVSKVILPLESEVEKTNARDFVVAVKRSSSCMELPAEISIGNRTVVYAYVSDNQANKVANGKFITLVLAVGPDMQIASPIQYSRNENCRGNNWINYEMTILNTTTLQVWNKEANRIIPLIDEFDLSGKYMHNKDLTMSFASFKPKNSEGKKLPLIIWLHGGGEGGTDPSIPLIANRAANYASPEIQEIFGGAYVLSPQCPGAWMHNAQGVTTRGKENDIYNEGLMALIKDYVAKNPGIDTKRIYLGGCSNGGYMTLKLVLLYPDYFAAAFPSALAYSAEFLTDEQLKSIKDVPIWFIQSKDDKVTDPESTAIPVHQRLLEVGAKNVHFTLYDHVIDITGFFGGKDYHYNGHWSWIYSHANLARSDVDGKPVKIDGRPVTLMEWVAAQSK